MTLSTIYTAATGLLTFSKGLDTVSNNVANLNTPGFKRSDLLFRDLFYQYQQSSENGGSASRESGAGVTDAGTIISFSQGDIQQTGNDTDMAIRGNGFFVLRDDENQFYSRAGQFEFDDDGFLSNPSLDARVLGLDENGNLTNININDFRISPANATSEVSFLGNLSTGSTTHEIGDILVIDSVGESRSFKAIFTDNSAVTPRSWLVNIEDEDGVVIASGLELRFQANGSPEALFNSFSFSYSSADAGTNSVTFGFGEPGSFNQTTNFSAGTTSSLAFDSQDGIEQGSLLNISVGVDGVIEASYSNEEQATVGRVALAWFTKLQSLRQIGNGTFLVTGDQQPIFGQASSGVFGDIAGGSIEISNVELTQEFTDLIIIQRGFQASSQIMSISNEMIQELLTVGRG